MKEEILRYEAGQGSGQRCNAVEAPAEAEGATEGRGTVVRFSRGRGTGAIEWVAGGYGRGNELFFYRSAIVSRPKRLEPGEAVAFVVGRREDGRACALQVRSVAEQEGAIGDPAWS